MAAALRDSARRAPLSLHDRAVGILSTEEVVVYKVAQTLHRRPGDIPVCIDGCYPEHHAVVPHQVTHLLEVHPRDLLLATTTTGSSRTTEYNPCGA